MVCQAEGVAYTNDGLEAVVFTADGDMRQALNNLQASGGECVWRAGVGGATQGKAVPPQLLPGQCPSRL